MFDMTFNMVTGEHKRLGIDTDLETIHMFFNCT